MPANTVYRAVADPTRRDILDLLRDSGPRRASDIAARFPAISRPAVSRHLRVLRRGRLVRERVDGRERWYRLDPKPLREVYTDWLRGYEAFWSARLDAVKQLAETDERARRRRRR